MLRVCELIKQGIQAVFVGHYHTNAIPTPRDRHPVVVGIAVTMYIVQTLDPVTGAFWVLLSVKIAGP
jgi:hypothetical protein